METTTKTTVFYAIRKAKYRDMKRTLRRNRKKKTMTYNSELAMIFFPFSN
jgi:hypothetical protein